MNGLNHDFIMYDDTIEFGLVPVKWIDKAEAEKFYQLDIDKIDESELPKPRKVAQWKSEVKGRRYGK